MQREHAQRGRGALRRTGLAWVAALAVLAPAGVKAQTPAYAEHSLPRPIRTALRLSQGGAPLRGEVLAWSELGVRFLPSGAALDRLVFWHDLTSDDAYNLRRRFLERDDARGWLRLGVLMLEMDDRRRAEQALGVATRLDGALGPIADRARELFEQGEDPAQALRKSEPADGASKSSARSAERPDAPDVDERAWPALTDAEQAEATEEMKRRCVDLFKKAGSAPLPFAETEHFLVFSDMAPSERRVVVGLLDRMYDTLLRALEIPLETRMYNGKCAVFIFDTRDRFLSFEKQAFNYNGSKFAGLHHPRGRWSHIVFYKLGSQDEFLSLLVHEATHSFMHRYRTSRTLPTWANEGLADYVAGFVVSSSNSPTLHWAWAKQFIMQGKNPRDIMRLTYRDGSWPNEYSYPVSHMLVRFMLKHKPREFKAWIDAIKAGAPWEKALETHFGVSADVLAQGFADAMRSEENYSR